ncbi:MAG: magnesium transporter CorA family protein [Candidatus Kuenenbacteria bacterium]
MYFHKIKGKNLTLININKPREEELEFLKKEYQFYLLDIKDCLLPPQRTKIVERANYLFMVLVFPIYNYQTKEIFSSEVDFFIQKDLLVIVHNNELIPLIDLFKSIENNKNFQEKYLSGNPAILLYEILNSLLLYCFPILNHISIDIDNMEKQIFKGNEKKMVKEILNIKQNIVNFRKIMQAHKAVVRKLIIKAPQFFSIIQLNIYFNNLIEYTKEIWDALENYKESINALQETNESLISFRLNDIMKLLTIVSVVLLPITLIASIFGMSIDMSFLETPHSFLFIIFFMLIVSLGMIWFFKTKKWL